MSIVTRQLDGLRARLPGCVLAAYGDASAQLILRSSAHTPWPQEKLDDLCRTGARHFAMADHIAPQQDQHQDQHQDQLQGPTDQIRTAVVATPKDVRVYVGAPPPGSDLLCCVCHGTTQTDDVVTAVRAMLAEVMEQER